MHFMRSLTIEIKQRIFLFFKKKNILRVIRFESLKDSDLCLGSFAVLFSRTYD